MKGKEKCKALKEIRKQIAKANDIEYVVSECKHQGDCLGTCPKCESELRYLERELAVRQGLGKAVAVVGISTSVCTSLTACTTPEFIQNLTQEEIAGLMAAPEKETVMELEGDIALPSSESASENSLEIENATELEGEIELYGECPETETDCFLPETETVPETEWSTETTTDWEIAGDISILPSESPTEEPNIE